MARPQVLRVGVRAAHAAIGTPLVAPRAYRRAFPHPDASDAADSPAGRPRARRRFEEGPPVLAGGGGLSPATIAAAAAAVERFDDDGGEAEEAARRAADMQEEQLVTSAWGKRYKAGHAPKSSHVRLPCL